MITVEAAYQELQGFVPPIIARQIQRNVSPITQPVADRTAAAVLFADITNFTALSEQIDQLSDSEAPEELANILNLFFDQLINIIHSYGGEVTKFAGDALIALWPVPESTIRFGSEARRASATAVHMAVRCGLEIQNQFPQEPIKGLVVSVELGIGVGDVYSVCLGGKLDRWEFLLSGSPLVQMSEAVDQAQPGEIVLSPEAWALVGEEFTKENRAAGYGAVLETSWLTEEKRDVESGPKVSNIQVIKPFLPAAIWSRLDAGITSWMSEMRRVSVMFVLLPGYGASITHPFDRTLPEAQSVMTALQNALYRYGGSINKLNVDNKGITLVAAFGLPPFSHPDDAARAVHSALLIQSELRRMNRQSSIGITTGLAYCGLVGNRERSEYTVIGSSVNLATRLMQDAEAERLRKGSQSELVCDESTYLEIQNLRKNTNILSRQLEFDQPRVVFVKGKSSPINVYQPRMRPWIEIIGNRLAQANQGTLIGRSEELNKVRDIVARSKDQVEGGQTELVLIEGEEGMGKTFFVGEIKQLAEEENLIALIGGANRLSQFSEYHPWKSIFQQLYRIKPEDSQEEVRKKVLEKLPYMPGERGYPAAARDLASLLNPVLPIRFPETSRTRKLDPATRKRVRKDFLLRLLQIAASPSGTRTKAVRLVVIEDVQWMDKASWELTLDVIKSVKPLVLVLTLRPMSIYERRRLPKAAQQVIKLQEASRLRLEGLTGSQISELASQSIGSAGINAEFVEFLQEATGGHPRLCRDISINLKENGLLSESGGIAALNHLYPAIQTKVVPVEMQKAVIGRLDQVPVVQQLILKIAAMADQPFTSSSLRAAYPGMIEEEMVDRHIEELIRMRFLRSTPGSSDLSFYSFDNTILRDEIRKLLPREQREEIQLLLASA